MKNLKINYLNDEKLSSRKLSQVRGGRKLCLCSCQLGADQQKGDEWADKDLNGQQLLTRAE